MSPRKTTRNSTTDREFAANAAHQLRTPLSALRLSLEEALAVRDPRAEIEHSLEQADRLAGTVDTLLLLGAARERGTEAVDVCELAGRIAAGFGNGGPVVRVTGAGRAMADPRRLTQVVSNLVDNGRRFARNTVRVSVHRRADRVLLWVEDDGPGIREEERSRVFDRFFRGRSSPGLGSGLGLAVATELARADGATISVAASELGGACFEAPYPAATV